MKYAAAVFVFVSGVAAHWLWSTHFSFYGIAPHVLLILTVAVASKNGPVVGQCYGFAWGLFLDVVSMHVFGANALGLTLAGYFVGMLRRQMDVASVGPQLILVALLTPVHMLFYGLAGLVIEHHFLWVGWKNFIVDPVYNCLIVPLAFEFTRRFVDL